MTETTPEQHAIMKDYVSECYALNDKYKKDSEDLFDKFIAKMEKNR